LLLFYAIDKDSLRVKQSLFIADTHFLADQRLQDWNWHAVKGNISGSENNFGIMDRNTNILESGIKILKLCNQG